MSSLPNPDEAAAIAAAIERFRAETAPAGGDGEPQETSPWGRAARAEAVAAKRDVLEDPGGGLKWLS